MGRITKWLCDNRVAILCTAITVVLLAIVDCAFQEYLSKIPSLRALIYSVSSTLLIGFTTPVLKKSIDKKAVIESVKKSLRPGVHELDKSVSNIHVHLDAKKILPRDRKLGTYVANAESKSQNLVNFVQ